jgi:hypothetical protein
LIVNRVEKDKTFVYLHDLLEKVYHKIDYFVCRILLTKQSNVSYNSHPEFFKN